MKKKKYEVVLIGMLLFIYFSVFAGCEKTSQSNVVPIPGLPQPIASEGVLITSAGQSTDTYIVKDIANQLMIHNYFMPQANPEDLQDMGSIVFVVGYSYVGEKLHDISFEQEKERIKKLVDKAKADHLVVITVMIGGKERRDKKTDELLEIISAKTDYLIGVREANSDNYLSKLAESNNIPITLVKSVNDISEPFASAFR